MTCMHYYLVLCTSSLARTVLPCSQYHGWWDQNTTQVANRLDRARATYIRLLHLPPWSCSCRCWVDSSRYIYRQIAAGVVNLAYIISLGKNNRNMIGRAKPIIYLYNGITWPTTRHYGNHPTAIYLFLPLPSPSSLSSIYLLSPFSFFYSSVDLPKYKLREESKVMIFRD